MFLYRPQLPSINVPHEYCPRSITRLPDGKAELHLPELPVLPARTPGLSALILSGVINCHSPALNIPWPTGGALPFYEKLIAKTSLSDTIYDLVSEINLLSDIRFVLHRIASWKQLQLILAEGLSPMVGHTVYDSFIQAERGGVVPMPKRGEGLLGGHIVNLVAFDPKTDTATALSNLGEGFGQDGKLTYRGSFIRNLAICCDFFVLVPRKVISAN